MTDIWDELWKNKPTSQGIYFNQLDWEKKVKTEGDRLKEKADDLDAHVSILSRLGGMMTEHAVYDSGKLLDIFKDAEKLEAVKDWWFRNSLRVEAMPTEEWLRLNKILEAEA